MQEDSDDIMALLAAWGRSSAELQREFLNRISRHDEPQSSAEPFAGPLKIWWRLSPEEQAGVRHVFDASLKLQTSNAKVPHIFPLMAKNLQR